MADDIAAQAQKLHAAFVKSLNATAEKFSKPSKISPNVRVETKRRMISDLEDRLKTAKTAQREAIRIHEREIQRREQALATLHVELDAVERELKDELRLAPKAKRAAKKGAAKKDDA